MIANGDHTRLYMDSMGDYAELYKDSIGIIKGYIGILWGILPQ